MYGLAAIPANLTFAGMVFQHESPHWLIGQGHEDETALNSGAADSRLGVAQRAAVGHHEPMSPRTEVEVRVLAEEQAALRRVATLVAGGAAPEEVFAAVAAEVGQLFSVDLAVMGRYDSGRVLTFVASWGRAGERFLVGSQEVLGGTNLATVVFETCRPARIDHYAERGSGGLGTRVRNAGVRSAVGMPIMVEDRLWGVISAASSLEQPLPPDTEARLASFIELVAAAIANAQSRAALARLAQEQAALRRVATLVARGVPPEEVFAAVTAETGQLLGAQLAGMGRYDSDRTVTVLAAWAAEGEDHPLVPGPWPFRDGDLASAVFRTGRPVRIGDYRGAPGPIAAFVRDELGVGSSVASPVFDEGRLWGVLFLHAKLANQPFAPDDESRLAGFTELVATAIANAENLAALAASRARIVTAGDEARRRIERELHDSIQQMMALMLDLRTMQASVPARFGELHGMLSPIAERLAGVSDQVRAISHGVHPAILSRSGLQPALESLALQSVLPVQLQLRAGRRLPAHVEVAAYYAVSEALTNAAKHARASAVHVELDIPGPILQMTIRDDGIGGADPANGSGLLGLTDRIEALGGTLEVSSPAGRGTTLLIEIPAGDQSVPAG
jgi:signal transduction histidine kinase